MQQLTKLLEFLEDKIDVEHAKDVEKLQIDTLNYKKTDRLCIRVNFPADTEFKGYPLEETHQDMAKMMFNELLGCLCPIIIKDTSIPMIRANYGVGTLPSAFGLKSFILNGNMPWVEHVSKDKLKEIVSMGVPDWQTGYGKRVTETYEFYNEVLTKYPKCREVIHIYHPDFQGPLDVAHLMYGSDIYMDMYEDPDFVHELLNLVTQTYIDRMKRILPLIGNKYKDYNAHWCHLYPGKITLRNDSAVNLSKDMYIEFAKKYDDMIYEQFGRASMHFCGRADHWVFEMAKSESILGLNFGYMPDKFNGQEYLDFINEGIIKNKKVVMGYQLTKQEFDKMDFEKYSTGISYNINAENEDEAKKIVNKYCS